MASGRVQQIAEGTLPVAALDAGERALSALAHKSVAQPAWLEPGDLAGIEEAYGARAAVEVVAYTGAFHFINRIADLVGIESDFPLIQRRFRGLRRLGVRFQGWSMGKLANLSRQQVDVDVDAALAEAEAVLGPLPPGFAALRKAPNVAGYLTTIAEVTRQLDPAMLERVTRGVADALPTREEEALGFHPRPTDPVDALIFVGTRYAARTTEALVDAVREKAGYDDAALTDLFYAISMRNGVERMFRLLAG